LCQSIIQLDLRLSSFSNFLLFSRILENLIIVDDLSL
jgi:hypothetical protein